MHHGFFWPCSAFFWPCDLCDFEFFRNHWFTMDTADRRKHLCDKDRVGTQLKNNSADILIIWDALLTYLNSQIYTSCSSPQTCECAIWVSCSFGLSMHFLWLLAIKNSFFLNAERHLEILFSLVCCSSLFGRSVDLSFLLSCCARPVPEFRMDLFCFSVDSSLLCASSLVLWLRFCCSFCCSSCCPFCCPFCYLHDLWLFENQTLTKSSFSIKVELTWQGISTTSEWLSMKHFTTCYI